MPSTVLNAGNTAMNKEESPGLKELIFQGCDEKMENNQDLYCQVDGSAMGYTVGVAE